MYQKLDNLKSILKDMKRVAVAFSGGVDSAFLAKIAKDVLDENVVAITADSVLIPKRELEEAKLLAKYLDIKHIIFNTDQLKIEGFSVNPKNRCYICKLELLKSIKDIAKNEHCSYVLEGSNVEDDLDFRPGKQAVKELDVKSPLKEVGFTKSDIRQLSKELGLKTWDKPSFACLASRFPYGETINVKKLKMIEEAEQFLLDMNLSQVRVRYHGEIARIEVPLEQRWRLLDNDISQKIYNKFNEIGFKYSTLDLNGYRTGSMNE